MKILILGATGQIGRPLFDTLRNTPGWSVVGTSRHQIEGFNQFNPFNDQWTLLGKCDVLINCIGQIEQTSQSSFHKIHLTLIDLIIKNRETLGSPRLFQLSALGAHAMHKVEFLRTKGQADELLLKQADTWILRPSIVCTPNTMLVKKLRMLSKIAGLLGYNDFVPQGFPGHSIQPVLLKDLIDLIERLLKTPAVARTIDVVGPDKIRYSELLKILFEQTGQRARIKEIPERIFRLVTKILIFPFLPSIINTSQYTLLFEDNVSDVSLTQSILGRQRGSTLGFWKEQLKTGGKSIR